MPERLRWQVGDEENGQIVQVSKTISTLPAQTTYTESDSITVSTTAIGLVSPEKDGANYAFITVETDTVRFLLTSDPTSTVGHLMSVGDQLELESAAEINAIRFIRSGSSDATLQVSYGVRS